MPSNADVHVHAAAFVVALLKNGYADEAEDFIEWYLERFGEDLTNLLEEDE